MSFANVFREIEELPAALALGVEVARVHEFPVALTNGLLRAKAPGERGVGYGFILALQVRNQIHTFDDIRLLGASEGTGGREEVQGRDRMIVRRTGGEFAWPGGEERNADAALKGLAFVAAERGVHAGVIGEVGLMSRATVVADEQDEGILVGAGGL